MMRMLRLELVVLRAADLERSRRFYEALGIHFEPAPTEGYRGQLDGIQFEICPSHGKAGLMRLGLRLSGLVGVVDSLTRAGGTLVRTLGSPKLLYAVVRDPDGNTLELRAI